VEKYYLKQEDNISHQSIEILGFSGDSFASAQLVTGKIQALLRVNRNIRSIIPICNVFKAWSQFEFKPKHNSNRAKTLAICDSGVSNTFACQLLYKYAVVIENESPLLEYTGVSESISTISLLHKKQWKCAIWRNGEYFSSSLAEVLDHGGQDEWKCAQARIWLAW
jgi:hypothetical protein